MTEFLSRLEHIRQDYTTVEAEAQHRLDLHIPVDAQETMTYVQLDEALRRYEPEIYQQLNDLYSRTIAELRL